MSDYFQHWLNMGKKLEEAGGTLPAIYCVNWFRTDENGKFVWPGFGDNMRVLKWMLERIEGKAGAGTEHLFGTSPEYGDLNWEGLNFTEQQFAQITSIDKAAWEAELKLHAELFDKLAYNLPAELEQHRQKLESGLASL